MSGKTVSEDQAKFNAYQVALAAMVDFLKKAGRIPASVSEEDAYVKLCDLPSGGLRFSGPADPEQCVIEWRLRSPWGGKLAGNVILPPGGFKEIQANYLTDDHVIIPAGTMVAFRDA